MPTNGDAPADAAKRVHLAFVYAFEKVGFLLTEQNVHTFCDEDVRAWNEAVAEGEAKYGPVKDQATSSPPESTGGDPL
jgi:hypothetical protein